MSQYETLDELIVTRIKNGSNKFIAINAEEVFVAALWLTFGTTKVAFRIVDSRLQALRKKGLISFNSKTGWTA